MAINYNWFKENMKAIVLTILGILLVIIIENWVLGTNNFLIVLKPFIRYLIETLLTILAILFIAIYLKKK